MATPLNGKRIVLGGLLGGLCWSVWSMVVNAGFLAARYEAEESVGHLLTEPRYGIATFMGGWFVMLFLLSIGLTWLYAAARSTLGPGPGSALKVGLVAGALGALPINFSVTSWSPVSRFVPLGWLMDILVGVIVATLVGGWFYRER